MKIYTDTKNDILIISFNSQEASKGSVNHKSSKQQYKNISGENGANGYVYYPDGSYKKI